ncbi:MAG: DUF951 domain-containing protein [Bacilli bacterium]|jgi:hypothetical protein|nr:DUF951 domain-containing protein [Acholeplasmataceae bacterium]
MNKIIEFNVGEIVTLKKPHPCGSYDWKILRTGVDFKLECAKCGRVIMIPRIDFLKRLKIKK